MCFVPVEANTVCLRCVEDVGFAVYPPIPFLTQEDPSINTIMVNSAAGL